MIFNLVMIAGPLNDREKQERQELKVGEDVKDKPVEGAVELTKQAGQEAEVRGHVLRTTKINFKY